MGSRFTTNYIAKRLASNAPSARIKPFEDIPGPRPMPLIGNIWRYFPLIGDYQVDTLYENAIYNRKRYGPIVRERITNKHTILHLFDPLDIESFFRQDSKYPFRRSHRALLKYRQDRPDQYLDGGLFPENGLNWHRQRTQFQSSMMSKADVSMNIPKIDLINSKAIKWIEAASKGSSLFVIDDFQTILNKWALANSLCTFLDLDIESLDNKLVDDLLGSLGDTLKAIDGTEIKTDKWINQPCKCPFYRILTSSQDFLHNFVQKRVDSHLKQNESHGSFSYLHRWIHEDKIHEKDIASTIMDFLLAGLHTTSYTFAFLLYNISTQTEVKHSVRQELEDFLKPEQPTAQEIVDRLSVMRDSLKETMRLNPIAIGTGRLTSHDNYVIRNHRIPKDIMVIAQTQVSSRDPDIYDDPDEFKPMRWLEYRNMPRAKRPSPFATLPFGLGARSCIGQRLSELQIKMMASRLLQRYDLYFEHPIKTKTTLVHNIDGDLKVKFCKLKT